jgi:predicted AlkP superfamily pyrophosphatase or phosphodiesterase
MKRLIVAVLGLLFYFGCGHAGGKRPAGGIERVLIMSVDGLGGDLLLRAEAPRIKSLLKSGSYTLRAQTHRAPETLPCHVSMLTGVSPERHGVTWNRYIEQSYPGVPTLFELAKRAGLTTAMAVSKMKFIALTKPGTLDDSFIPHDEPIADRLVAAEAMRMIDALHPHVLFVHFAGVDTSGHEYGWGSPEQHGAVGLADRAVGAVLDSMQKSGLAGSTLVILTADHGGVDRDHSIDDPRVREVPWIACGPGVTGGFDLSGAGGSGVRLEDTFATACASLGLASGASCEGKSILDVPHRRGPAG